MSAQPDPRERNLGPQPIAGILESAGLRAHDLVAASTEQITHKMVSRACKGRRLTANTQRKMVRATKAATGRDYRVEDLFNYRGTGGSGKV